MSKPRFQGNVTDEMMLAHLNESQLEVLKEIQTEAKVGHLSNKQRLHYDRLVKTVRENVATKIMVENKIS